jgi:DNA polymerase III delta prime subunit
MQRRMQPTDSARVVSDSFQLPHLLFYGPPGTGTSAAHRPGSDGRHDACPSLLHRHPADFTPVSVRRFPRCAGKTSTILAMARELYGPELMKKRVLELNASNERGIDVIRHKVKVRR